MPSIIVYSTPACPYCRLVKEFLESKGVDYLEKDVSSDEAAGQEMIDKSGQMGVPVIEIDGEIVIGFDREKIEKLIKKNYVGNSDRY